MANYNDQDRGSDEASRMERANIYAASFIQSGNDEANYGQYMHRLEAPVLFRMFKNILRPLVKDTLEPNELQQEGMLTNFVAYTCLGAMYSVMRNKALRINEDNHDCFGPLWWNVQAQALLPVYCVSLINSIGPINFNSAALGGTHIPVVYWQDIINIEPEAYEMEPVNKVVSAMSKLRIAALSRPDVSATASSTWWSFHAVKAVPSNRSDSAKLTLYSPARFEECTPALKLGVLFAQRKLAQDSGPVNSSATPFYGVDPPARVSAFPYGVRKYRHYWGHQKSFYAIFEPNESQSTGGAEIIQDKSNKRPLNPTDSDVQVAALFTRLNDGTLTENTPSQEHRVVYYYFDHIPMKNIDVGQLDTFALKLNEV